MLEETHLQVEIDRLILDDPGALWDIYLGVKTYACQIIRGDPKPGLEPEVDTADRATITSVGWFDLRGPNSWDSLAKHDPITCQKLQQLRMASGYVTEGSR